MKNTVIFDGYKVTTDRERKEMTFERKVGTVLTTTTIGWVEGNVLLAIETMKRRDAKYLAWATQNGWNY
jgi:hypothetical protein